MRSCDAAKRVLTKEKLDKQLSGQTANSTPFMSMEDTLCTLVRKCQLNPKILLRKG